MRLKFWLLVLCGVPGWLAYLCPLAPFFKWLPGPWWLRLAEIAVVSPAGLPILAGLILIPVQTALQRYITVESSKYPGRQILVWRDRWMFLWGNLEDGIAGADNGFWPKPVGRWEAFRQIFIWSAVRNSVGNARWLPFYGLTLNSPAAIYPSDADRKEGPYIARAGWHFELRFCWNPKQADWTKRRYFWCGWRLAGVTTLPEAGIGYAFQPKMGLA